MKRPKRGTNDKGKAHTHWFLFNYIKLNLLCSISLLNINYKFKTKCSSNCNNSSYIDVDTGIHNGIGPYIKLSLNRYIDL